MMLLRLGHECPGPLCSWIYIDILIYICTYICIYTGKDLEHDFMFFPQYGFFIDTLHQGGDWQLKANRTPERQYQIVRTQRETQHTCLLCHTADMSALPDSRHVCYVTQQTVLLGYKADMSDVSHSRHVCCYTADMSDVPHSTHVCCVTQ